MARTARGGRGEAQHKVRAWRRNAGLTLDELGDRIGMTGQNLGKIERGMVPLGEEYLAKLASVFGIQVPDLFREPRDGEGAGNPNIRESVDISPVGRSIPVLGDARAGSWERIPDEPEVQEWLPMEVPGYEGAELFAVRVRGRSMDLIYPDGTYVICAPPAQAGLQEGDCVVIRRRDPSGRSETTLKQIERQVDGSYALFPRSTLPEHQEPIPLPAQLDEAAQDGALVLGVVLLSYRKDRRGRGPLIRAS